MKKILITGTNSYIGNNLKIWLARYPDSYSIETISLKNEAWKTKNFSNYDVVFHVAGIAHVSSDPKMEDQYYKVNRDLTIETAKKAKRDGVRQFIFLSSIIVYGDSNSGENVIGKNTKPNPSNFYGDSKLQAEEGIKSLESDDFAVVIVRPPMIYGQGSKGNYSKLSKIAQKTPFFPDIDNKRSMLYIDNLCEFIKLIINNEERGIFFPQNNTYTKTSDMVKMIAGAHGKEVRLTKIFNPFIKLIIGRIKILNKVFGNLVYEKSMSEYKEEYVVYDLRKSVMLTEELVEDSFLNKNVDILMMSDNNLETVGGEQESTKIIIEGIKDNFSLGVIQPGLINDPLSGVNYFSNSRHTRIKHIAKKPLSFLKYILLCRKIIKQTRPKVIHSQAQVSFFIAALLKKFKPIPKNITLIHTERGLYLKYNKLFKKIFQFFIKELDIMVTTTDFNMKYWKEAVDSREIPVIFKVIENTAGELFESYDKKLEKRGLNQLVIGFAGRYCDWKNWPLAVEICEKLNDKLCGDLYVKMAVGCLDDTSKKETEEMFEYLTSILGDRFEGLINVDIQTMSEFYYNIDVFILTSDYNTESFGRTLVEAMSRKTVVLTTNAGGSVEVVGGFDKVLNTADEFSSKISELQGNKELMKLEKEKNLRRVRKKYSLSNNIEKHLEMYRKALNSPNLSNK